MATDPALALGAVQRVMAMSASSITVVSNALLLRRTQV
jgi:cation transport ATPase